MDRPRTDQARRRRKRWIIASAIVLALIGLTVLVTRLKPAAPTVERSLVWIDTVKRGEMLREVRGIGTLVPEQISWIAARSAGRVDRILLHPGAVVKPDDVILVLSNPDVTQAAADAASCRAFSRMFWLRPPGCGHRCATTPRCRGMALSGDTIYAWWEGYEPV